MHQNTEVLGCILFFEQAYEIFNKKIERIFGIQKTIVQVTLINTNGKYINMPPHLIIIIYHAYDEILSNACKLRKKSVLESFRARNATLFLSC